MSRVPKRSLIPENQETFEESQALHRAADLGLFSYSDRSVK